MEERKKKKKKKLELDVRGQGNQANANDKQVHRGVGTEYGPQEVRHAQGQRRREGGWEEVGKL